MSGFRGDYTSFEWLLMGIFLLGLPIAAVLGALIGLAGKWKQGYVVTAAVYGLAGSAAAAHRVLSFTGPMKTKGCRASRHSAAI